jgi:phospholipid/cholesterol/gamma-HCH transport system permease protein
MKAIVEKEKAYTLRAESREEGDVTLFIQGHISIEDLHSFVPEVKSAFSGISPSKFAVDLSGVTYLDSAAALTLLGLEDDANVRSIPFTFLNITDDIKGIMKLLDEKMHRIPPLIPERKSHHILEQIGEESQKLFDDFFQIMTFVGELLLAMFHSILHPRSIRWEDTFFYMKRAGVDGLPIVALISLLLGLIMAFMSSLQLKQFGANIYVASLVGIAMVKELGPIMTAIIVAGRSGSAFAAEIGTMIVNDEVNALMTMGLNPTRFLAVPKVLAAVFVVPLLTLYADFFAILGGLIVGIVGLDLTVYTYVQQTQDSIQIFDIVSSLIKSVVFAMLISGIGCQRGFQVKGGAESVGTSTTSAVVSAIFLIIVADSAFAIILHYID